jgi:hypothetical protein
MKTTIIIGAIFVGIMLMLVPSISAVNVTTAKNQYKQQMIKKLDGVIVHPIIFFLGIIEMIIGTIFVTSTRGLINGIGYFSVCMFLVFYLYLWAVLAQKLGVDAS